MSDELQRLARDLARRGPDVEHKTRAIVSRGTNNIKRAWRAKAKGLAHAPAYPFAVTSDLVTGPGYALGVVGPDKDLPQGALGNIIEFGSAHNAPLNHGGQALAEEEPRFLRAMEELGAEERW